MILRVVPLAKLLPTAHFPFYENPSPNPWPSLRAVRWKSPLDYFLIALDPGDCLLQKSSGLFAYRKRPTYDLKVFKYGSFANAKLKSLTNFAKDKDMKFSAEVQIDSSGKIKYTPETMMISGVFKKSGSYLLSHLVGQYHRRW